MFFFLAKKKSLYTAQRLHARVPACDVGVSIFRIGRAFRSTDMHAVFYVQDYAKS